MVEFSGRVHELSLSDEGNGFFLESAEDVVNGAGDWHPTNVTGALDDSIIVFGTDGGGGLFAVSSSSEKVYRLEGGALVGPTYDVDDSGVTEITGGFWGFLELLRQEFAQAV